MKKIPYIYILFLISTLWIDSIYASPRCKDIFNVRIYIPQNESKSEASEMNEKFLDIKRKQQVIQEIAQLNKELREQDSRPDFNDKDAYEKWLAQQQKSLSEITKQLAQMESQTNFDQEIYNELLSQKQKIRASLKVPYGYGYRIQEGGHVFFVSYIRKVPFWFNHIQIDNIDLIWRDYTQWAEAYVEEHDFYPPFYVNKIQAIVKRVLHIKSEKKFFKEDRGLSDVLYTLGQGDSEIPNSSKLFNMIDNLTGDDLWIDGGTGKGLVIQDAIHLLLTKRLPKNIPHITGITLDKNFDFNTFKQSPKHRIEAGQLFEEMSIESWINNTKLITDFHGIFSYSSRPDQIVNKYLQMLKQNGSIAIVYNPSLHTVVRTKNKEFTFAEWLSLEAPFLQIKTGQGKIQEGQQFKTVNYIIIQNPSEETINLPFTTFNVLYQDGENPNDASSWKITRILRPLRSYQKDYL